MPSDPRFRFADLSTLSANLREEAEEAIEYGYSTMEVKPTDLLILLDVIRERRSATETPDTTGLDVARRARAIQARQADRRKSVLIRPRADYRELASDIAAEYARLAAETGGSL